MKLGLAMPLDWEHVNRYTHISMLCLERPDFVYLDAPRGGDIAEKREGQIEKGMELECTHFAMLDGDMVYPEDTLKKLMDLIVTPHQTNKGEMIIGDMAGGLVYRGYPPYEPVVWERSSNGKGKIMWPFQDFKFGEILDAGATGCACLLVKRQVFEEMERPWFRIQKEEKTVDGKVITIRRGEDTYFTENAVKKGFRLLIDTTEDVGHMRLFQIDRHFWVLFTILAAMPDMEHLIVLLKKVMDKKWIKRHLNPNKTKVRR